MINNFKNKFGEKTFLKIFLMYDLIQEKQESRLL